jgi:hypothetical protein
MLRLLPLLLLVACTRPNELPDGGAPWDLAGSPIMRGPSADGGFNFDAGNGFSWDGGNGGWDSGGGGLDFGGGGGNGNVACPGPGQCSCSTDCNVTACGGGCNFYCTEASCAVSPANGNFWCEEDAHCTIGNGSGNLWCESGSTCVASSFSGNVHCTDDATCQVSTGEVVVCSDSSHCSGPLGDDSVAQCSGQSTCSFTSDATSVSFTCNDTASCSVACTHAGCGVECNGTGSCSCTGAGCVVACPGGAAPLTCSGGRKACGSC